MKNYTKLSLILAVILLNSICLKSYSQNRKDSLLQEINQQLAEGCEAKELLASKTIQLKRADSTSTILQEKVKNLDEAVTLEKANTGTAQKQRDAVIKDNNDLNSKLVVATEKVEEQRKWKKFWRNTALIETGVAIIVTLLVFL